MNQIWIYEYESTNQSINKCSPMNQLINQSIMNQPPNQPTNQSINPGDSWSQSVALPLCRRPHPDFCPWSHHFQPRRNNTGWEKRACKYKWGDCGIPKINWEGFATTAVWYISLHYHSPDRYLRFLIEWIFCWIEYSQFQSFE